MENIKKISGNGTTIPNGRKVFSKSERYSCDNLTGKSKMRGHPLISLQDVEISKEFVDENKK